MCSWWPSCCEDSLSHRITALVATRMLYIKSGMEVSLVVTSYQGNMNLEGGGRGV